MLLFIAVYLERCFIQIMKTIMINLSFQNEILFFELLSGQKSIQEFEKNIYENDLLENEIGSENYLKLISFDYKGDLSELFTIVENQIIKEYRFESWKVQQTLEVFISDPENLDKHLNEIYNLYFGVGKESGKREYDFKFLKHLALNYFYWLDEGYLKMNFGENWEKEYQENIKHFDFYHQQLKPFSELILSALDNKDIEILENGTYNITEKLKEELELKDVYQLQHPLRVDIK